MSSVGDIPDHEIDTDITSPQDGGIMKGILVQGTGKQHPREDAVVKVNWEGFRKNKRDGEWEMFERKMGTEFTVGSAREIWAIEEAVLTMKKEEKCIISAVSPYIFRAETEAQDRLKVDKEVYEDARRFYVELVDFKQVPDPSNLPIDQKLELAMARKQLGNEMFKDKMFRRAIKKYQSAIGCFAIGFDEDPERVPIIRVQCYLNIAACFLHLEEFSECIRHCDRTHHSAKEDFQHALICDPSNEEAKRELNQTKRKINQQRQHDKRVYSKMMELSNDDEENDNTIDGSTIEVEKKGFMERFFLNIFTPGVSSEHLKVFYGISLFLLAVLTFVVYSSGGDFHSAVLLFLASGLVLSILWFVSQLPDAAKIKPE